MKIVAVIPARLQAVRLPQKMIMEIGGKPLIRYTFENVSSMNIFDEVYVATDSQMIFDEIVKHGGKAIMTSEKHQTGSDRISEAVKDMDVDVVVNVQGDEPFITKKPLQRLIEVFKTDDKGEIDIATLTRVTSNKEEFESPHNTKLVFDSQNFAMYFSRQPIPYFMNKDLSPMHYLHVGVYAFRKRALLDFNTLPMCQCEKAEKIEAIRYLEYGRKIKVVETTYHGIQIDTPQDLDAARLFLKNK